MDPALNEGKDFSILFYGGALMAHLSADETQILQDFIQLPKINRNLYLVLDSDFENENDELQNERKRGVDELENSGYKCWITKGRTIENYIPQGALEAARSAVHTGSKFPELPQDNKAYQFTKAFNRLKKNGDPIGFDKTAVARKVVANQSLTLEMYDIEDRIRELSEFIKAAKG